MDNFCPNCGNAVRENAVFCDSCGKRLGQQNAEAPGQQVQQSEEAPGQQVRKGSKGIMIIDIVLMAVLILQIVIACFVRPGWLKNSEKDSSGQDEKINSNSARHSDEDGEWVNGYWNMSKKNPSGTTIRITLVDEETIEWASVRLEKDGDDSFKEKSVSEILTGSYTYDESENVLFVILPLGENSYAIDDEVHENMYRKIELTKPEDRIDTIKVTRDPEEMVDQMEFEGTQEWNTYYRFNVKEG